MSSKTVRRRLRHGDVDGKISEHVDIQTSDSLNEPLLGDRGRDKNQIEVDSL